MKKYTLLFVFALANFDLQICSSGNREETRAQNNCCKCDPCLCCAVGIIFLQRVVCQENIIMLIVIKIIPMIILVVV